LPFCPRCGNRNPAGAKFCSKCGGSLAQTDETAISPHAKHTRLGLASLILGIVAFITIAMPIFGSIFGILAVAFGAQRRRESYGEAGIILGIVCIIINFVLSLAASAT